MPGAPRWEPPPAFTAAAAGMQVWPAPVADTPSMPPWPAATGEPVPGLDSDDAFDPNATAPRLLPPNPAPPPVLPPNATPPPPVPHSNATAPPVQPSNATAPPVRPPDATSSPRAQSPDATAPHPAPAETPPPPEASPDTAVTHPAATNLAAPGLTAPHPIEGHPIEGGRTPAPPAAGPEASGKHTPTDMAPDTAKTPTSRTIRGTPRPAEPGDVPVWPPVPARAQQPAPPRDTESPAPTGPKPATWSPPPATSQPPAAHSAASPGPQPDGPAPEGPARTGTARAEATPASAASTTTPPTGTASTGLAPTNPAPTNPAPTDTTPLGTTPPGTTPLGTTPPGTTPPGTAATPQGPTGTPPANAQSAVPAQGGPAAVPGSTSWPPPPQTEEQRQEEQLPELPFTRDIWGKPDIPPPHQRSTQPLTTFDLPTPPHGTPGLQQGPFKQPPVQQPLTAQQEQPGKGKRALLATLGVLVLAGVTTGGFFAYRSLNAPVPRATTAATAPTPPPTPAGSASPTAALAPSVPAAAMLDTQETDPKKMSAGEAFPEKEVEAAGAEFTKIKTHTESTCQEAASGPFAEALRDEKCSRVLRATYVDAKRRYAVTSGIAVFPSRDAALRADRAKNLSRNVWFRPLPGAPGSGGERVHIAGGYAAGLVWGRYIVFSYATYADGHTPATKDKTLGKVSDAFRDEMSLVLERRIANG